MEKCLINCPKCGGEMEIKKRRALTDDDIIHKAYFFANYLKCTKSGCDGMRMIESAKIVNNTSFYYKNKLI